MMTFEALFKMGVDRDLPPLLEPGNGVRIELGATGIKRHVDLCLGLPQWRWPQDPIPLGDETAAIVHAYHFMEHLTGEDAILMLKEIQRVLKPGGIFQFCIPWAGSEISFQDLTHKSFWTESSFRILMNNGYYAPSQNEWQLKQHYLVIAAVAARNFCLFGQLVKVG